MRLMDEEHVFCHWDLAESQLPNLSKRVPYTPQRVNVCRKERTRARQRQFAQQVQGSDFSPLHRVKPMQ